MVGFQQQTFKLVRRYRWAKELRNVVWISVSVFLAESFGSTLRRRTK
jgi:hypothetical protein